jgi:AGZA family xanthine/uracil permease-like MFS transporter
MEQENKNVDVNKKRNFIDKLFKLKEHGTTIKTELIAGVTSFMTMAYIIIVNPAILSNPFGANQNFNAVLFSTVLISFVMSVVMGIISNNPYAVAPGMGLNAYISFSLVGGGILTYQEMMGAIIIAGALLTIMSLTPISGGVLKAIPKSLRLGLAAGIGLFLVFIGFQGAGIVVDDGATLVAIGPVNLTFGLFFFGLILTAVLMIKKVRGAFLIGIVATSLLGGLFSIGGWAETYIDPTFSTIELAWGDFIPTIPDTSLFGKFDLMVITRPILIIPIFTLAFTDLFDSVSTFIGVSEVGGLVDKDGNPIRFQRTLIADSMTTMVSGFFGTSDATTYIESASGVEQGGRTGLTAIITGLCFVPFMFFSPLLAVIPGYATAPVLVLLGVLMFKPLSSIDWTNFEESIPAFAALVVIPFTYSITWGIVIAIILYVFIKLIGGKGKEINAWLWLTFVFALFALLAPFIETLINLLLAWINTLIIF